MALQLCYRLQSFSLYLTKTSEFKKKKKKEKERKKKLQVDEHIYKRCFQNAGEKLLATAKVFLNLVSLSRKRLCKGLSIQYAENNVITSNKFPVVVY